MILKASVSSQSDFLSWHCKGGEVLPLESGVPLSDRGFRYGEHLFESIAIRNGVALLLTEHLSELTASAKQHGFPVPKALLSKLCSFFASTTLKDGMLRLYLTAGPGAPASPIKQPGCYLTWESTHFPTTSELDKGYALTLLNKSYCADHWGVKSGNYAPHLEALRSAREAGADEAIVCDPKGRILSCAMGNLIVWIASPKSGSERILATPSFSVARRGAVLQWVASQSNLVEQELQITDLSRAHALAITNSRLGVMPVATIDGRNLPEFSKARKLAQDYLYAHDFFGGS